MSPDERRNRVLASESRMRILDVLRASDLPLSTEAVAARVGLQPATARFHLHLLVSAGLADRAVERRATAGRPTIVYSVAAEGAEPAGRGQGADPQGEDGYQQLAAVLADQIASSADPAAAAREAGRRWADALDLGPAGHDAGPTATIDRVVGMMERLGFAPRTRDKGYRIDLFRCPYEAVAHQQRGVVCGAHAALLEETLERMGGSVQVTSLESFVSEQPLLCVVRLARADLDAHAGGERGAAAQ